MTDEGRRLYNVDEDDGYEPPYCSDVGLEHGWGPWMFAEVGTHEFRLCRFCGGMEQQGVTP